MRAEDKFFMQTRVDPAIVKAADRLSVEWSLSRAAAIERLLREAIDRYTHPESGWPWTAPA